MHKNLAMRGASEEDPHRVLGGSFTYERRLLTFYFLAFRNFATFLVIVKDEAIADAPWVRFMCNQRIFYEMR